MDTITGISTPIGCGAISIVRLSGDSAIRIALHFFSAKSFEDEKDIESNKMYLGIFTAEHFKEKCMLVTFRAPKSYTGEDVVEFHLHGGVKLTNNVISELVKRGARPATAGEFTKRAFINGKISLSEAEGIMGIINAESEAELNAAYRLMQGEIGKRIKSITQQMLEIITLLSATLDYPEEMAEEASTSIISLKRIKNEIDVLLKTSDTGKLIKNGINVAILGRPNAGKSSLLNAILKKDRAIVTEIAGTTRDVIKEGFIYQGIKINFLDTAGVRDSKDKLESMGIAKALEAAAEADVILYLIDITEGKNEYDKSILHKFKHKCTITAYNKSDKCPQIIYSDGHIISAKNKNGIDRILKEIIKVADNRYLYGDILTEKRHINAMTRAKQILEEVIDNFDNLYEDCILIDLNNCYNALMEIEGETATEKIINNIFSKFLCGQMREFDAIVVGAGHAGTESALALARLGKRTLLAATELGTVANMACNPNIGGTAKGHLVREIDALGGEMGIIADKSLLQIKMLNSTKGAAVQSLRGQTDKSLYHNEMLSSLKAQKNLTLIEGEGEKLIVEDSKIKGVIIDKTSYFAKVVIIACGVYLRSKIITGEESVNAVLMDIEAQIYCQKAYKKTDLS